MEAYGFLRRLQVGRVMPERAAPRWYREVDPTAGMTAMELRIWRKEREAEPPRKPPLTRAEIGRMEEALTWLEWVQPDDVRKIVVEATVRLAVTGDKRVAWGRLRGPEHAERLRKAYGRAITEICDRLNRPKPGA